MNVFIDPEPLYDYPSGMSIYVIRLIDRLLQVDPTLRLVAAHATVRPGILPKMRRVLDHYGLGVRCSRIPIPGRLARNFPRLARAMAVPPLGRIDLVHATANTAPTWMAADGLPLVITIHDLVFLRWSDMPWSHQSTRLQMKTAMRHAAHNASAILTVSDFTRREAIDLLGVPADKITVTPLGVQWPDDECPDREELIRQLDRLGLDRDGYLLNVGTLSPRKNVDGLVQAFTRVRLKYPDAQLVIVGKQGWYVDELALQLRAGIDGVRWLENLPGPDLMALYCGARAVVIPSHYEGFGIPVLEAMRCGTPVCFGTGSGMDDVAGDAGLGVTPTDTDALAATMERLWIDEALRRDLSERGLERSGQFSWRRTAELTLQAYRKALR